MTLPYERYRAVTDAREFLLKLLAPGETPGVPPCLRMEASAVLKHFPNSVDLDQAAEACPDVFEAKDPLTGK